MRCVSGTSAAIESASRREYGRRGIGWPDSKAPGAFRVSTRLRKALTLLLSGLAATPPIVLACFTRRSVASKTGSAMTATVLALGWRPGDSARNTEIVEAEGE